ncbi:hypothetical protein GNI_086550 [Gregarina niphandrodes]|uniref:Uncharacterized protein n=1 Tax=Gregarina niphandrodes TaxID=110365 RepID=A0A023B605_GRENI|nr:hypothetical protein GNI_086550 [Gregarina niphandrodes]EZG63629.1 hypothetical protein GNI_086550 [Gregarina niphandrodes]|eukprot:XP_011130669.1 hypothetical protein GNI_086550 [Gregarina niphandrodes]
MPRSQQDGPLLASATEALQGALWNVIKAQGLGDLQWISDAVFKKNWRNEREAEERAWPGGGRQTGEANVRRALRNLRRTRFTPRAELPTALVARFSEVDANQLDEAQLNSLTVVRRSTLLLSLYACLWSSPRSDTYTHTRSDARVEISEASDETSTQTGRIVWTQALNLLSWAAEADAGLDADGIFQECLALIIDVEKRVYAISACRGASETFHDKESHSAISNRILT